MTRHYRPTAIDRLVETLYLSWLGWVFLGWSIAFLMFAKWETLKAIGFFGIFAWVFCFLLFAIDW